LLLIFPGGRRRAGVRPRARRDARIAMLMQSTRRLGQNQANISSGMRA
jgi:hypothetical protein